MDESYIRATIVLFDSDIEILDRADASNAGRSATIRRIIREWAELTAIAARRLVDTAEFYSVGSAEEI